MNELNPYSTPKMMSKEEARKSVISINSGMNNIRIQLLKFYEREGWRALGYESWSKCVVAEFGQSRQHLYRQLEAAQIEQRITEAGLSPMGDSEKKVNDIAETLSPMGDSGPIPERILRPLADLPPEEQAPAWELAKETAPDGKMTAAHVEKTVREIKGEEPKKSVAPRTYAPGSLLKDTSDAMLLATAAIEALERIDKKDPQRKAAIAKVAEWCWQQNQANHVD